MADILIDSHTDTLKKQVSLVQSETLNDEEEEEDETHSKDGGYSINTMEMVDD